MIKMIKEEKKAIETLKEVASDEFDTLGDDISPKMAQNILNVIDKQQKEIEELKEITQNYNAIGGETFGDDRIIVCSMKYFNNGYFKNSYISKQKLRDLIDNNQDDIDYSIHDIIKDLKELLED